jgi:hypothetical protein
LRHVRIGELVTATVCLDSLDRDKDWVLIVNYPRQESHNPAKTLGISQNANGALQKALHFLPSPDKRGQDLTKFIAALSQIPETERQNVLDLLSGLQIPEDALVWSRRFWGVLSGLRGRKK